VTDRVRTWLSQWGPMLPLLIAEATVWAGFGALLPILPIYFTEHGVSLPMLGIVVAAWPAARLVGEPIFGRIADSAPRRTMMVIGLFGASVFAVAPLFVVDLGVAALILTRVGAGLCAAIYDPAARGYLADANPPERQGETFGLYGAAQMGGLMLGPAIGGIAAGLTGNPTTPFWMASIFVFAAGVLVWARVREIPHVAREVQAQADATADSEPAAVRRPMRLRNRLLVAAIVIGMGSYFAGGAYEVVWSLYLTSLGASLGLIGLTFFTFALPILLLSPVMGRFIDHQGGFLAIVVGGAGVAICGTLYALVPSVWFVILLGLVEGTAFALSSPAQFLLVVRSSPVGRTSTAQGIFGAAGTIGTIAASLSAGFLAEIDLRLPFLITGIVTGVSLLIGLAIGRRALYDALQPTPADLQAASGLAAGGVTSGAQGAREQAQG
jgi:MFS family permease